MPIEQGIKKVIKQKFSKAINTTWTQKSIFKNNNIVNLEYSYNIMEKKNKDQNNSNQ